MNLNQLSPSQNSPSQPGALGRGDNDIWQQKTQWPNVVAVGKSFADRLIKGAHVFVQGELTTREYDRTIKIPVCPHAAHRAKSPS